MIYPTAKDWLAAREKRVLLFGMSGLGKTRLSAILAEVESKGESFLICRSGKPVALLARPPAETAPDPLKVHPKLRGRILYDPTEPATDEDWPIVAR